MRVDVKDMAVRSTETGRESRVKTIERVNGKLLLQGAELERTWSMIINENSGRMSATIDGDGEGFILFGVCGLP